MSILRISIILSGAIAVAAFLFYMEREVRKQHRKEMARRPADETLANTQQAKTNMRMHGSVLQLAR